MNREEKLLELEKLKAKIAVENDKSKQLQDEIIKKTKQLVEHKISFIDTKTRRNLALFEVKTPDIFNINDLPDDYIFHLNEKNDELNKLRFDFESVENNLNSRINEIDHLIERQSELMVELANTNASIFEQKILNIPLKMNKKFYQKEIKEFDIFIKEAEQIKKKAENSLSTVIQRVDLVGGGKVDLVNEIKNIKEQINVIDQELNHGLHMLTKYQDDDFDSQLKFDQEMNQMRSLYSWDSHRTEAQNELRSIQQSILTNKEYLNRYKEELERKEVRLNLLLPITQRYKRSKVENIVVQPTDDFNSLSKQLTNANKDYRKASNSRDCQLSSLLRQNTALEKKIEARTREFNHMSTKFAQEYKILQNKINEIRVMHGERENEIINTIRKITIKNTAPVVPENIFQSVKQLNHNSDSTFIKEMKSSLLLTPTSVKQKQLPMPSRFDTSDAVTEAF
ncbi:hypothetical protein TRFO_29356 [Tritrichomonas foetus]|uniref:Uncharacterized protein n=1 Tax=Tritrichomonas foetus TaxID=1144522 RepID=A0A1J4K0J5_9EUKA|nr:hypothetical protein TRFO_29356 [Tritrichomonas foetus]|eukprot:OHT03270.1 hypothetical protein TRFO_29356 [Tritrichomonas foetus]